MHRVRRIVPWLLLVLVSLPGLLYTGDPFARDQGVFAYIGWRWIHGDVPYAAAGVEHKGPLPFVAYALAELLLGHSMFAARLLAWLALLGSGLGVAWLARRIIGRGDWPGAAAGAIYLLTAADGPLSAYWSGAQAETWMEPFAVAAMALACLAAGVRRTAGAPAGPGAALPDAGAGSPTPTGGAAARGRWLWVGAGAAAGIATLGKPTAILLLPVLFWAAPGWKSRGLAGAWFLVPWGAALAGFSLAGAGGDFVDHVLRANLDYGGRGLTLLPRMIRPFFGSHGAFIRLFPLALPCAALGVVAAWRARSEAGARLAMGWLAAAYLQVIIQGRMFGYHYYPVVAPVALVTAWGAATAWEALRNPGAAAPRSGEAPGSAAGPRWRAALRLAAAPVLVLAAAGVAAIPAWSEWSFRLDHLAGRMSDREFLGTFAPGGRRRDVEPEETLRAARWVEQNLKPDQTLLLWGFEPAVNFLARRRSPTRFIYDYYLTSRSIEPDRQRRYWELFWQDLAATPPDWICVVHNDVNPVEREDSAAQLEKIPRLRSYLDSQFEPVTQLGDFQFFRRVRPPTAPGASGG